LLANVNTGVDPAASRGRNQEYYVVDITTDTGIWVSEFNLALSGTEVIEEIRIVKDGKKANRRGRLQKWTVIGVGCLSLMT